VKALWCWIVQLTQRPVKIELLLSQKGELGMVAAALKHGGEIVDTQE